MRQLSITPNITVTIGRHTRIYYAFVTSAPINLDAPATMTLHAATFADVRDSLRTRSHTTPIAPRHQHGWCSWTRSNLPGSAPATAATTTSSCVPIPCSSD